MERRTYTTEEIEKMTGLSIFTIRKQVRDKTFPVRPISGGGKGGVLLFPKKPIDDWLDGKFQQMPQSAVRQYGR